MSLAKLKSLTASVEAFNRQAEDFANDGRNLSVARELLVKVAREMGFLVKEAEGMFAKIRFEVTMPEPDMDDMEAEPQAVAAQEPATQEDAA